MSPDPGCRRDEIARRMADSVVNRLTTKKVVEVKDEALAKASVRQVLIENIHAEGLSGFDELELK